MLDIAIDDCSGPCADAGNVLSQYRTELEWLAYFLTGDQKLAEACVTHLRASWGSRNDLSGEALLRRARRATIGAAVQILSPYIAQLAPAYESRPCLHPGHRSLSLDSLELVSANADLLVGKMDVLCRCVLVICGMEQRPFRDAALLLGITRTAAEAAYCAALYSLKILLWERCRESNGSPVLCH